MNIQDLKHRRKINQNKENSRLDWFSWNRSVFLVSSEKIKDLKKSKRKINKYLRMQVRLDLKSMVPRQWCQKSLLTLLSAPDLYTASARFRVAFPLEYSPKVYQSTEPKRQETIY